MLSCDSQWSSAVETERALIIIIALFSAMMLLCAKLGFATDVAEDGDVACEKVRAASCGRAPFDVVFMDRTMPVMDGLEVRNDVFTY